MKTFRTDEELLAARDAAFQQCRYESISAIVNSLAERKELDVFELDFPVRINEKVALVDKIGYVDGDSFRLYYSDSDFNGYDEHSAGNIGRLSGGTHSLIVRQGDFKDETLLSLEALVLLRFLTEFMARVGDSDFTDEEFAEEIEGKTTTELMKLMFRL